MTAPNAPGSAGRVRVAVVYGGRSSEHAISCVSAGSILRNLDPERFEVVAVGITPGGSWVLTDGRSETLAITDGRLPQVSGESGTELALPADPVRRGQLRSLGQGGEILAAVDVVFPVLHGPYGEDGTIQGLLELAGVPYVGAGVLASAAGMDKEFTKKLLVAEGLPIGDHVVLRPRRDTVELEDRERLGLPVFVKPARGGSSIGVSRVTAWDQLPAAIALARRHDPKVIVEAAVAGRELECGVLEFPDGRVEASTVGEIRVAGVRGREDGFYDFETKYLDDAAELDVPAKIDDDRRRCSAAVGNSRVQRGRLPGSGPCRLFPHRQGAGGQRNQHHARLHDDLDVSTDVGGQRRRLSNIVGHHGRDGAETRHRPALAHRSRVDRRGRQRLCDRFGDGLDRRRPRSRRQCQGDVDRPVDRKPRAAALVGNFEPLHSVDDLDGGADDELGWPVQPAPQDDRLVLDHCLPCRRTGRRGIGRGSTTVVTQLLRDRVEQRVAFGGVGPRRGHSGDGNGSLRGWRLSVTRRRRGSR